MANTPYEVIKIADGSWRIEENGVRSFLFVGTEKALLVDTGFGSGDLKAVVEGLTELPVILANTHADGDHTGCNLQFPVAHLSPSEYVYYHETKPDAPVAPLWDGDIIDLGGRSFEVVDIPGHTTGSVALLDRAGRVLISGDTCSAGAIFMFGKHRNLTAYIDSIKRLIALSPAFDVIYPSHGDFPLAAEALHKLLAGALALLAGELEAAEPPFPIPAKLYSADGAAFLY
ncbi:MAG: MBL fold metallo-hydrolase [Oscillospiraceae bacterium]|jgi:glyoxylase-like metal-dependent hydrolase (beta-lactamase superfamily II)|nr:MBL fold metallo-hydrolase [Oscillospiraceae bacterium]